MHTPKGFKLYFFVVLTLLVSLFLAACGDSTATTAPTPTPKTPKESIAAISGVKVLDIDQALILGDTAKMMPGATIDMFVSDEEFGKLAPKAESAITGLGFKKFDMPAGASSSFAGSSDGLVNLFVKGETSDLMLMIAPIPTDTATLTKELNLPADVDKAAVEKLTNQLKGRKTIVMMMGTPGMLSGMIKAFSGMDATTAPVVPTTSK
jgi:hypothetical protein